MAGLRRSATSCGRPRQIVLLVALGLLAAACVPVTQPPPPPGGGSPQPTLPPPTKLGITTNPSLFPRFDPAITDYVVRCTGAPVVLSVAAPPGTRVSVDGRTPKSGRWATNVLRTTGQRFSFTVQVGVQPVSAYNIRCLPTDFLSWSTSLTGPTQSEWYLTTTGNLFGTNYPTIFDPRGVPIWWGEKVPSLFVDLLPDNTLLQVDISGRVVHKTFDGTTLATVETANVMDFHDALLLSTGHYLVVDNVATLDDFTSLYPPPEDPDTPPMTPPDGAEVLDHVFQAIDAGTGVVWDWKTSEHIEISETGGAWRPGVKNTIENGNPADAFHWNSVAEVDDGYIFSMRHEDAVYKVTKGDGGKMDDAIKWKLGGTEPPSSGTHLSFANDELGPVSFGGQHDARWDASTSTLTLFDNGSGRGREPRAVRYAIDEVAGTATLLESVTHPDVPTSNCCGSARRLAGGNWVIGWGSSTHGLITEQQPNGPTVFRLEFTGKVTMYRTIPIPFGQLDRATLIAAMDARHP